MDEESRLLAFLLWRFERVDFGHHVGTHEWLGSIGHIVEQDHAFSPRLCRTIVHEKVLSEQLGLRRLNLEGVGEDNELDSFPARRSRQTTHVVEVVALVWGLLIGVAFVGGGAELTRHGGAIAVYLRPLVLKSPKSAEANFLESTSMFQ